VPFITYWKNHIKPNVSDAIVCQIDLLASLGNLVGVDDKTTDSKNLLSTLLGEAKEGRDHLIVEANSKTALRSGDWIMIPPYKGKPMNKKVGIETGISNEYKLFKISEDKGQENNLAKENPKKLEELIQVYKKLRN
jgi:arylsulfatase A-like enzyme